MEMLLCFVLGSFSYLSPNIKNVVFKMLDPHAYHQEFEDWQGDEPTFEKILEVNPNSIDASSNSKDLVNLFR